VNKKEITLKMSRDAGITLLQAQKAFDAMVEGMKKSLNKGDRITVSGFGSFERIKRKARMGRNPQTGETISIPSKKSVKFNPSRSLKGSL
jgi:DNA-binding protein HU-beta